MTDITTIIKPVYVLDVIILVIVFVLIAHGIVILLIQKQIHHTDRVGTNFTHKLLELGGYINMIILGLIFILLILPI